MEELILFSGAVLTFDINVNIHIGKAEKHTLSKIQKICCCHVWPSAKGAIKNRSTTLLPCHLSINSLIDGK